MKRIPFQVQLMITHEHATLCVDVYAPRVNEGLVQAYAALFKAVLFDSEHAEALPVTVRSTRFLCYSVSVIPRECADETPWGNVVYLD